MGSKLSLARVKHSDDDFLARELFKFASLIIIIITRRARTQNSGARPQERRVDMPFA